MEERMDRIGMLDLMVQPAFCVNHGIITKVNDAARRRMIETGTPVNDILATGIREYAEFEDGCLYLSIYAAGSTASASVTRMEEGDIFVLEHAEDQSELQAMALAAQQLRQPLAGVMSIADNLFPISGTDNDPQLLDQVAHINRGLYQLQRIICNMSDAYRYCQEPSPKMEIRNVCSILEELFSGAVSLIQQADITLQYSLPKEDIFCLVDEEKLERAINNMISNAMKFASRNSKIYAQLTRRENMLYLTVQDCGNGVPKSIKGNLHSRYLREPGIEDGRHGIGLGMVIIQSAAAAHGGAVLIQHPQDSGTRITFTMPIRQNSEGIVRSAMLRVDYAGEQDHRLLEFSDSLPPSAYRKK